jgi:hypothetical protein
MRLTRYRCASRTQRADDAHHGAARQRLVTHEHCAKSLTGEQTTQQSHRRAGIAAVERSARLLESVEPNAMDQQRRQRRFVDSDAHRPKGINRGYVVFPVGKPFNTGVPFAKSPNQHRSVTNAFV